MQRETNKLQKQKEKEQKEKDKDKDNDKGKQKSKTKQSADAEAPDESVSEGEDEDSGPDEINEEDPLGGLLADLAEGSEEALAATLFPPRQQLIGVSAPAALPVEMSQADLDRLEWKRLNAGGILDRKRKRSAEDTGDKEREEGNDFLYYS